MGLVEGLVGEGGVQNSRAPALPVLTAAVWILSSVPELAPMLLLSQQPPPQNPIPSSKVPAQGGRPMLFL